jgi:tetratricopeptide (TPR) repeat protein
MNLVVIQALLALGQVELALGDTTRAERFLREAHEMAARGATRNPLFQAIAARLLAEAALKAGDHARARASLEEAIAIVSQPEQDNWIEQAHCQRLIGQVHVAQGRRDEALKALQRAGDLYHKVKNPAGLHEVITQIEVARKQELPTETRSMSVEARWNMMSGLLR